MWKEYEKAILEAISTHAKLPEVEEYGYAIYRLPLTYEGRYVGRDLLCLSWESEKLGKKIRPIRVVSSQYYLIPHSHLEAEMIDAGFRTNIIQVGTHFKAEAFIDSEAYLLLRNSYRVGAVGVDIYVKTKGLYLPVFKDAIRYPHRATNGPLLTKEALEEVWEFAKLIPNYLPALRKEYVPLSFIEFVKNLKVIKREYENGVLVKEETDEVGKKLYACLRKYTNLYEFVLILLRESEKLIEMGYGYRKIRDRIERYTGTVIREVLDLRGRLQSLRVFKEKTA